MCCTVVHTLHDVAITVSTMHHADAIYYGQKSCSFDDDICDGWTLRDGARIVNTTTHDFTVSGNFTQNGKQLYMQLSAVMTNYVLQP